MKWVTMWGNAQSTVMPQPAVYAKDITLRYPIYSPFKGNKIRINLDNYCCSEDVEISRICISKGDKLSDKQNVDVKYLTYNNQQSFVIKAHSNITTDEVEYNLLENEFLIVSIYLEKFTNLTSGVDITGPLSKGYFAYGNQLENNILDINKSKSTTWVYFLANVDIYTDDNNEAVICYGDSITSQDWPDYMQLALKDNNINNVAVVRKAVSGTRVLREYSCILYQSYGLKGENRFIHEVSSVSGANKIIIQHGINDIIHPVGLEVNPFRPMSDMPTVDDLINGINYYLDNANKLGFDAYVGTLLPIYNWRTYNSDKELVKNEFNKWILKNKSIDFNNEIGYLDNNEWKFKDLCDSGDHLHPSKHAYKLMGELAAKIFK